MAKGDATHPVQYQGLLIVQCLQGPCLIRVCHIPGRELVGSHFRTTLKVRSENCSQRRARLGYRKPCPSTR